MVSKTEIDNFIKTIPPLPDSVRECINALKNDDLTKAANAAANDKALGEYLISIVNRASFGFSSRVTDFKQIFSILGLDSAKQILISYLVSIIAPKKWELFSISNKDFNEFQALMIDSWNKISQNNNYNDKYKSVAVLLGSAIIVCEEIFKLKKRDVEIIKSTSPLSYDKILKKLSNISFVEVAVRIGEIWEIDNEVLELLMEAFYYKNKKTKWTKMAKFLHLVTFYELSKGEMLQSGLNEFIEFDIEFVQDIYPDFLTIMNIEVEDY